MTENRHFPFYVLSLTEIKITKIKIQHTAVSWIEINFYWGLYVFYLLKDSFYVSLRLLGVGLTSVFLNLVLLCPLFGCDCLEPVLSYCLADFPMTLLTVPLASSLDFYRSLASIPLCFPKNLLLPTVFLFVYSYARFCFVGLFGCRLFN